MLALGATITAFTGIAPAEETDLANWPISEGVMKAPGSIQIVSSAT